jgi:hypothetical protein
LSRPHASSTLQSSTSRFEIDRAAIDTSSKTSARPTYAPILITVRIDRAAIDTSSKTSTRPDVRSNFNYGEDLQLDVERCGGARCHCLLLHPQRCVLFLTWSMQKSLDLKHIESHGRNMWMWLQVKLWLDHAKSVA